MDTSRRRQRFSRFSELAGSALAYAKSEAERSGHAEIGTGHLLAGLIAQTGCDAAAILPELGFGLDDVAAALAESTSPCERAIPDEIGLSSQTKRAIELALDESDRMKHEYIGTGHLLLGLMLEGEGSAANALKALGVDPEQVREQTVRRHPAEGQGGPPDTRP